MAWHEAFAVLRPLSDWPAIRRHKIEQFYELARGVREGCIVELGTFRGLGTIALALGARDGSGAEVFTIDDRVRKRGWAGEPYEPDDEGRFQQNVEAAQVRVSPVVGESLAVAATWRRPVGLLVWDLGVTGRLERDFAAWKGRLVPSGLFAVKDIDPPGFGREAILADAEWELAHDCPDGLVYVYRRRVLDRLSEPPG